MTTQEQYDAECKRQENEERTAQAHDVIRMLCRDCGLRAGKVTTRQVEIIDRDGDNFILQVKYNKTHIWLSNGYNRVGTMWNKAHKCFDMNVL